MATAATESIPATAPVPPISASSVSSSSSSTTTGPAAAAQKPAATAAAADPGDSQPGALSITTTSSAVADTEEDQTGAASGIEAEEDLRAAHPPGDIRGLLPDVIDSDIFAQLLEMDDEEDHDFSKGIVWNYFDQAESTFTKMDEALGQSDLLELSTLGHFLKGSSAAVGVIKVRDSCECMQHYGKMFDSDGITPLSHSEAVGKLTATLKAVKVQYREASIVLRRFYDEF